MASATLFNSARFIGASFVMSWNQPLEHSPEKWIPVFRRKCDHVRNPEHLSDST